jgi:hypothetical protein
LRQYVKAAMRTSALDRADQDIERGDYGLARQRLTSYLSTEGYKPDVMARIGQISYDMHDMFQAGRFWLLSSAAGDGVDDAVARFIHDAGSESRAIVGQLPRVARLCSLEDYPDLVQERLRRFGLDEAIVIAGRAAAKGDSKTWGDRAIITGCLITVVLLAAVFLIGVGTVVSWLLPD